MNGNSVNTKLIEFAKKNQTISLAEAKEIVLTWYEPFQIWADTITPGTENILGRKMESVAGPSGDAVYDYDAMGYMVLFSYDDNDFRTIVWSKVKKLRKDGVTYNVR